MQELVAESLKQFVEIAESQSPRTVFRGVDNFEHRLLAKAARLQLNPAVEQNAIDHFRLYARSADVGWKPTNELEWMALAQHHGLATRLLDWTNNALAALFFAIGLGPVGTRNLVETRDAAVYILPLPFGYSALHRLPNPLQEAPLRWGLDYEMEQGADGGMVAVNGVPYDESKHGWSMFFVPYVISPRIAAQSALLSISRRPDMPLDAAGQFDSIATKVRIPASRRLDILRALLRVGVHRQALFPDLDGIARHAIDLAVL